MADQWPPARMVQVADEDDCVVSTYMKYKVWWESTIRQ
jgi:hypothetical protein